MSTYTENTPCTGGEESFGACKMEKVLSLQILEEAGSNPITASMECLRDLYVLGAGHCRRPVEERFFSGPASGRVAGATRRRKVGQMLITRHPLPPLPCILQKSSARMKQATRT